MDAVVGAFRYFAFDEVGCLFEEVLHENIFQCGLAPRHGYAPKA
jgi:hypothetical protein